MQRMFLALVLMTVATPAFSAETGSRALSGWFNVTGDNGWRGRRYMDGSQIVAEEFATNPSGRINVWRFYRRGILSSEERDLNGDGKVDLQTRWDSRSGLLIAVMRDTHKRGVNDLEIELVANQRWEIREDRNLDGVTDRIIFLNAPNDLFERLNIDFAGRSDVVAAIPREYWREMHADDAYTGSITDYYRYNSRGVLVQYGEWDGRRVAYRRCPPDFVPIPAAAPAPAPIPARPDQYPAVPYYAPDPMDNTLPTVRDPFDLSAAPSDPDPYAGIGVAAAPMPSYAPPVGSRGGAFDPRIGGGGGTPYIAPPPVSGPSPWMDDGSTYRDEPARVAAGRDVIGRGAVSGDRRATGGGGGGDLSVQDSAARAIPARMRPPGASTTRRR